MSQRVSSRRMLVIAVIGLLLLWLATGGIAIQRTEHWCLESDSHINEHERLQVLFEGRAATTSIPLMYWRYSLTGPYHLKIEYQDYGQKRYDVLCLRSLIVTHDGKAVEVISPDAALTVPFVKRLRLNSTSEGIGQSITHHATVIIPHPFEMPFEDGGLLDCRIDGEVRGKDGIRQAIVVNYLFKAHRSDFIKPYWCHLSN